MPADSKICLGEALQLQKFSVILHLLSKYHGCGYYFIQALDRDNILVAISADN